MKKLKFSVTGMSCAACQAHVIKAVADLDGVKDVNVSLINNIMEVQFAEDLCSVDIICRAVKNAGYGARPLDGTIKDSLPIKNDNSLKKLIAAFSLLIILMYFSMGNMMWGLPAPDIFDHVKSPVGNALLQLLLTIPILFIYRNYFVSGFKKLFKAPNMDSLIAVGATASLLFSLFATFMIVYAASSLSLVAQGRLVADTAKYIDIIKTYTHTLYYEAAAMILTLVSLGKFLENFSKRKTTDAVKKLTELAPQRATLLVDGKPVEVMIEEVKVGDTVIVKKGERVPVDGIIAEGSASFDQSNITGESLPVFKEAGAEVFSSTVITAGFVKITATKVGENTSFSNIIKMVDQAANSKAPISKLADKISGIFVPVIFCIALLTFIINFTAQRYALGAESSRAFEIAFRFAVTVIVIACPCALGLATPVAVMVGTGKGAQNGLIIRNAEILEKAHLIKTVVMDKTGTITEGSPKVVDFKVFDEDENQILSAIYSLENKSEHPLAAALIQFAQSKNTKLLDVINYRSENGKGVFGTVNGDEYGIGNTKILSDKSDFDYDELLKTLASQGKTPLVVIKNGKVAAVIAVKDSVRQSSFTAIERLKERNIKVVMLTGDNYVTAKAVADEVGITEVIADVLPEDKQNVVKSLKTDEKHLVAMVGDGVNDAPALTSADIGIAVGGASDVAMDAGDIVLLRKDLTDIVNVINLSRRTLNTIKLSLFWAFFYNFICVFIATGALYYIPGVNFGIKPEYGSVAMSISSVSVVLTALTINFFKPEKSAERLTVNPPPPPTTYTVYVEGMMCKMCEAHVKDAAMAVDGVISAQADHNKGTLTITATSKIVLDKVVEQVQAAGYKAKL